MSLSIAIAQTHTEQDNSPSITHLTIQCACQNRAINETSADGSGKADCATSAGFISDVLSKQVSQFFGCQGCNGFRLLRPREKRGLVTPARNAVMCHMGGPSKAGAGFPCQRVKTRAFHASFRLPPDDNRG